MRIWQLLFLASLAALPVQLGKFFFLKDASYVLGLPIDYLAITIYFSDIVVVSCLPAYLWQNQKRIRKILKTYKTYLLASILFVLYVVVAALFFKSLTPTGIYFLAKLIVLIFYSIIAADFFASDKRSKAQVIIWFSTLWQSAILIAEFALQRSLNIWILGERSFDASTVNIAHIDILGQQLLRPYGTFPHPNVAAAFILVYLVIATAIATKKRTKFQKVIVAASVAALLLTFSKTAIAAAAVYFFLTTKNRLAKTAMSILVAAAVIFFLSTQQFIPVATIAERALLAQSAFDISLANPFFGEGPTNFIRSLSTHNLYSIAQTRLLQPVHNIFLLILAEEGIMGLLIFTAILFSVLKRAATPNKQALFLILLIFGSFDHFLLTLHQGQLLLFLTFGYILSKSNSKIAI